MIRSQNDNLAKSFEIAEQFRHWNQTERPFPTGASIPSLFEEQARRTPDNIAAEYGERTITYSELNGRANQLARSLLKLGVSRDSCVGVCFERSIDLIVALLAILKSGGAYLPLDPSYPAERLAIIAEDAKLAVILVHSSLRTKVPSTILTVLALDELEHQLTSGPANNVDLEIGADSLAYVNYTSGSTGVPKGIGICHRSVARLLINTNYVSIVPTDRIAHASNTAFDAATFEIWGALFHGARLVGVSHDVALSPQRYADLIETRGITTAFMTTALFNQFAAERPRAFRSLRYLMFGGEVSDPKAVREVLAAGAPTHLVHIYGPTEVTTFSCYFEIKPDNFADTVPIGHPIANTRYYVLKPNLDLTASGETGELYLGGPGLARGYFGDPAKSAEQFIPDAFSSVPGERLYRTGDVVRLRDGGILEFVGRMDHQIKVRGFRIELGEIEAVLSTAPSVRQAIVVPREISPGQKRLTAYFVAAPGVTVDVRVLREFLQSKLPEYMVPSGFLQLDQFPLSPNGKINRKNLPVVEPNREAVAAAYTAPASHSERLLGAIWAEALGQTSIGINDNFFELGGDSIVALKIVARANRAGLSLSLGSVYASPTIAQLARGGSRALTTPVDLEQQGFQRNDAAPEIGVEDSYPLTPVQRGMLFHSLEDRSLYVAQFSFQIDGAFLPDLFRNAWRVMADAHPVLRTVFRWQNEKEPLQLAQSADPTSWQVEDWSARGKSEQQDALDLRLEENERAGFDLAEAGMRFAITRLGAHRHRVVWTFHHALLDGWSRSLLLREIFELYAQLAAGVPPSIRARPSFGNYVRRARDPGNQRAVEFFKLRLEGCPGTQLSLPKGEPERGFRRAELVLTPEETELLRSAARRGQRTLGTIGHAAWALLLSRNEAQRDVVFGTAVSGRPPDLRGVDQMVGVMINTVPFRLRVEGTVDDYLNLAQEAVLQAREHELAPLNDVLAAGNNLFNTILVFENYPDEQWLKQAETSALAISDIIDRERLNYDYALYMVPGDRLTLRLVHQGQASTESLRGLLGQLRLAFLGLSKVNHSVDSIAFGNAADRAAFSDMNSTAAVIPNSRGIHQEFEAQVDRTPTAIAVVAGDIEMTFADLDERANRIAWALKQRGIRPEDRVGICLDRTAELIPVMLGVLKAGAAYVPLDPQYPAERIQLVLEDCGAVAVVTHTSVAEKMASSAVPKLLVDSQTFQQFPAERLSSPTDARNLAYVIYTSGSTGRPKGAMVEHRNVLNFFAAIDSRLGPEKGVWAAVTSISFDISVLELFWSLCRGFKVVLVRDPLAGRRHPAGSGREIAFSLFYFGTDARSGSKDNYRLLLEGAKFGDRHGFDSVWTPERHFFEFGGMYPNPSVTGAAIAAATSRIGIRAGSVVAPLQNTLRIAEEWSLVDNLSGGRVGIAFASGWHADDFVLAPEKYSRRHAVMFEQIDTIQKLWRGERLPFPNGLGVQTLIGIRPTPIQPSLPMWITTSGTKETYRRAGALGANILTHLLGQDRKQLAENIVSYRQARLEAGHLGRGVITLMLHTFVGADSARVRELVREPFKAYLRSSVELIRNLPEVGKVSRLSQGEVPSGADLEAVLEAAFDRYFESAGLFGTPDKCAQFARSLSDVGVDEIACLIDFGVAVDSVLQSLPSLNQTRVLAQPSAVEIPLDQTFARQGVTHFQCTPSLARALLLDDDVAPALRQLRVMLVGGEALSPELAADIRQAIQCPLHNMYGPTETTVWSSSDEVRSSAIGLGRPFLNTQFHVQDYAGQVSPLGVSGELFIGGAGVARGYLNRPDLTAERFVPDPESAIPGARLYRTGDRVRWLNTGNIEFLGRSDFQVKIRGHRIEIGEIESRLAAHRSVAEVAVEAVQEPSGALTLVAYVVAKAGQSDAPVLRQWAAQALPEYMVPAVVFLDALPLTPNKKIDRKALRVRGPGLVQSADPQPPQGGLEQAVASLFIEILGVPNVNRNENFFELGGHSMSATRLSTRVRSSMGIPFPVRNVFDYPTVAGIAEVLTRLLAAKSPPLPKQISDQEVQEQLQRMISERQARS